MIVGTREELERAAIDGDAVAMYEFAYHLATSSPPDVAGARQWYEKAAAAGHVNSMNNRGVLAINENPPDVAGARRWYEQGAVGGDSLAMFNLAGLLADRVDPPEIPAARYWYERAAEAGYAESYFKLAYLLAVRSDPPDYHRAKGWYEKAAEAGSKVALHNLGLLHVYSLEPRDRAAARRWFERSAAAGDADSAYELGLLDEDDGDRAAAVLRYEEAAAAGVGFAMNNLGRMIEAELGTAPNVPAAREWYERAVVFGSNNAKINLARLRGIEELPVRPEVPRLVDAARIGWAGAPPAADTTTPVGTALAALFDDAPYRRNPFRLAGLSADADARQLRKRTTELEASERLGAPPTFRVSLPVTPAPEIADVKAALNQLREPVQRLLHELLWVWPIDATDAALFAGNDLDGVERHWLELLYGKGTDAGIAAHNIAVVRHIRALEGSRGAVPETWLDALTAWDAALNHPAVWSRLLARGTDIDDRRLGAPVIGQLRRALPAALLRPHTDAIVRAARAGDIDTAEIHLLVLDRFAEQLRGYPSAFTAAQVGEARAAAVRTLAVWVKEIAAEEFSVVAKDPKQGSAAANRMLDRTRIAFQVIDRLVPWTDPVAAGAHDDIVPSALGCDIRHFNETKDVAATEALLQRLGPLATTPATRDRLTREWSGMAGARIEKLCDAAQELSDRDARQSLTAARELLSKAQVPLSRLRAAGTEAERLAKFQDIVARVATNCAVAYFNETGELDPTGAVLTDTAALAVGQEAKDFIGKQQTTLAGIRRDREAATRMRETCWFCGSNRAAEGQHKAVPMYGEVVRTGNHTQWKSMTIDVPRCAGCRQTQLPSEEARSKSDGAAVFCLIAGLISLFIGFAVHAVFVVTALCVVGLIAFGMNASMKNEEGHEQALRFPPVVEYLDKGWKYGQRP
ncbi:tetratricopeptide repeat protein [Nocardia yamanashiensis]|uniref:tetratricopeptide repeat protein n=1 Tax=Nocardia yamanashiensis TaxID=209247 RepID=UPI00082BBA5B|nr:tetratricopeptide repeat protein [Nocardia yamanashiensis]